MGSQQTDQGNMWQYPGERHSFGVFLRTQRQRRGLSRPLLARLTGIGQQRIETLELNQSPPTFASIQALAGVLDIAEKKLLEIAGYIRLESER